jgi:hypothetical protein
MNLENIFKPIEQKKIEKHEKELENNLLEIQFQYVDNLFSKKIEPFSDDMKTENFREMLSLYTEIPSRIMKFRYGEVSEKELNLLKDKILDKVSDFYFNNKEHWVEEAEKLLNEETKKYEREERDYKRISGQFEEALGVKEKYTAGLIGFEINTHFNKLLTGSGISEDDDCLQIHFEELYKQKKGDEKNLFSDNSLEKLAIKIIEEFPQTKAIVAQSWLMDTPIAKRIGFTVYNKDFDVADGGMFWGQFIDNEGQIKKEEVLKFLETGQPKYKIAAAAIKVEDFLKKYLPEDRKGKIKLKGEISEEAKKFKNDVEKISKELKEKWETSSFEDILKMFNSNEKISVYLKTPDGQKYIDMFRKFKESDNTLVKFSSFKYKDKDIIKNKFDAFVLETSHEYAEREVII